MSGERHLPLTAKQRAELRGYISPWIQLARAGLYLAGLAVVGHLCHGLALRLPVALSPLALTLAWSAPVLALAIFWLVRGRRWTGGPEFRRAAAADLRDGLAVARSVTVAEAILYPEREDEGPAYLLRTAEGAVLLGAGQRMNRHQRRGFPWASFELVEAPQSGVVFTLRRTGARLKPLVARAEPPAALLSRRSGLRLLVEVEADFGALREAALRE